MFSLLLKDINFSLLLVVYLNVAFKKAKGLICLFCDVIFVFPHLRSSHIVTRRYLAAEVLSSLILW